VEVEAEAEVAIGTVEESQRIPINTIATTKEWRT
jgi:hypothetical protein